MSVLGIIIHPLLTYFSLRDVMRSILTVNKHIFEEICRHYLCKHNETLVSEGSLKREVGKSLNNLLYNLLRLVEMQAMFPFCEQTHKALIGPSKPPFMFKCCGRDLPLLFANFCTNWLSQPKKFNKGVFQQAYDDLLPLIENSEGDDRRFFTLMRTLMEDEVQYWYHSRVFGSFIVLFDRPDGTVLVSEDLKSVYLVVDFDLFRLSNTTIHPLLPCLSLRDVMRSLLTVNKHIFEEICRHYLCRHNETIVVEGSLIAEHAAELNNLLYNLLRLVEKQAMVPVSEKSQQALSGPSEPFMFMRFGKDLSSLFASLYTNWLSQPRDIQKGLFAQAYDGMLSRIERGDEDDRRAFTVMRTLMEDEVQYWYHSRVFGSFIVLFDRPDGTVLVSEDLKSVYLVVDFDLIRLSSKCVYFMADGDVEALKKHNAKLNTFLPFGPLFGRKATVLLLPYKGLIINEGAIFHAENLTQAHVREAIKCFMRAVDENKLIASLPKGEPTLGREIAPPLDQRELARQKIALEDLLRPLRDLPLRERSFWCHRDDEVEGPPGTFTRVGLMLVTGEHHVQIVGEDTDVRARITAICEACRFHGYRVSAISFAVKEIFQLVAELLKEMDMTLIFQPQSCEEEYFYITIDENPKCVVCACTTTPLGKKVMKCTRCNGAFYCCVEHQREDWPQHRKLCHARPA